jgi:hypothetical protein
MSALSAKQMSSRGDARPRPARGEREDSSRSSAVVVGALYIIGTVAGVLSFVVTGDTLDEKYFLLRIPGSENQVRVGALLVLLMGLSLAMIPVVMYPILRKYNEILALGYVVFRGALETATYLACAIGWLLLLPLSRSYVQAGAPQTANYHELGATLLQEVEISAMLTSLIFPLGAMMFYYALYRSTLVPRWLSGWGLLAAIPYLAAGLLQLFAVIDASSPIQFVLDLPMLVQEMVLALWLILRGFAPSRPDAGPLMGMRR